MWVTGRFTYENGADGRRFHGRFLGLHSSCALVRISELVSQWEATVRAELEP